MAGTRETLAQVLSQRLWSAGPRAQQCLEEASEVIIFGSMSVGLQRPDSDMDVLCIGGRANKQKTKLLDLIAVPPGATENPVWLQSELATHVCKYGIWLKGKPHWQSHVHIGPRVVSEKRRRVSAFMVALQTSWYRLNECFHVKYSVKLRRETQRLILLEQDVPVPPTIILDCFWASTSNSPLEVRNRLRQLSPNPKGGFLEDLLVLVDAHFQSKPLEGGWHRRVGQPLPLRVPAPSRAKGRLPSHSFC